MVRKKMREGSDPKRSVPSGDFKNAGRKIARLGIKNASFVKSIQMPMKNPGQNPISEKAWTPKTRW